jgi:hypothetical protein
MARLGSFGQVRINSGADSAALGNTAANFGRNAQTGLALFANQMDANVAREDERLTNEAIAAALSGGPQVSGNRRVDAQALQESVQSKGTFDELMQTSDLTQTGLGIENRMNQFKESKQEDVFNLEKRATELGMDVDQAQLATEKFQQTMDKWDFNRTKELANLDDRQRVNSEGLDAFAQGFEDNIARQILSQQGPNPSQDQINAARVQARARMQGPEGRQAARQEMTRLGASERAWNASSWGRRDALAETTEQALLQSRAEARDKRIEREGIEAVTRGEGDFSLTVADEGGNLGGASKEVVEAQKRQIATEEKAVQTLSRNGVNTSDFGDEERQIINEVRAAFPTSSLFVPIVKSFTVDGEMDAKALRTALATGQRDIMLAQANLAESTIGGTPRTGGGRGNATTVGKSNPGMRKPAEVARRASTPEQGERDLEQLARDVKAMMDDRLAKLQGLQTEDKRVQNIADQFAGIFTNAKDPGKPQQVGGFLAGKVLGASDEPLGIEELQKKVTDFDNWFKNVKKDKGANSASRTDQLLQRMLNSEG